MWLGYIGQVDVYWLYTCCLCFRLLLSHRYEKLFLERLIDILLWLIFYTAPKPYLSINLIMKIKEVYGVLRKIFQNICWGLFFYIKRCIFKEVFIVNLKHCAMDIPNSIRDIFYHVHIDFIHNVYMNSRM